MRADTDTGAAPTPPAALRRRLRERRRALADAQRADAVARLCARVAALDVYRAARRVATFHAFDGEADPAPLQRADAATAATKTFYLPIVDAPGRPLRFAPFRPDQPLRRNRYGLLEPEVDEATLLPPPQLDLVLTPLVGFDAGCGRLGVGGGFYDRTFAFVREARRGAGGDAGARRAPYLLGFAFELQKLDRLPRRDWDVVLDAVATECALYRRERPDARAEE